MIKRMKDRVEVIDKIAAVMRDQRENGSLHTDDAYEAYIDALRWVLGEED